MRDGAEEVEKVPVLGVANGCWAALLSGRRGFDFLFFFSTKNMSTDRRTTINPPRTPPTIAPTLRFSVGADAPPVTIGDDGAPEGAEPLVVTMILMPPSQMGDSSSPGIIEDDCELKEGTAAERLEGLWIAGVTTAWLVPLPRVVTAVGGLETGAGWDGGSGSGSGSGLPVTMKESIQKKEPSTSFVTSRVCEPASTSPES